MLKDRLRFRSRAFMQMIITYLLIGVGCAPERLPATPDVSATRTIPVPQTQLIVATVASQATATTTPRLSTIESTARPASEWPQSCTGNPVVVSGDSHPALKGVIAQSVGNKVLLTLEGQVQASLIAQDAIYLVGFSPDRQRLAYFSNGPTGQWSYVVNVRFTNRELKSSVLSPIPVLPLDPEQGVGKLIFARWINNERILFTQISPNELEQGLLDPLTGIVEQSIFDHVPNRVQNSGVDLSPTFDRSFYVAAGGEAVLWDTEKQRQLWRSSTIDVRGALVGTMGTRWSPDGSYIAFGASSVGSNRGSLESVYLLDRDGQGMIPIADLTTLYTDAQVYYLTWSPNGRYLAFAADGETISGRFSHDILLYDTLSNRLVSSCPLVGEAIDSTSYEFTWLSDSQYIAYVGYSADAQELTGFTVVDLQSGQSFVFEDHSRGSLGGWSDVFRP